LQMKDRELQLQKAALEKTTAGLVQQKKLLLEVSPPTSHQPEVNYI
jgi:hypothetical protein